MLAIVARCVSVQLPEEPAVTVVPHPLAQELEAVRGPFEVAWLCVRAAGKQREEAHRAGLRDDAPGHPAPAPGTGVEGHPIATRGVDHPLVPEAHDVLDEQALERAGG